MRTELCQCFGGPILDVIYTCDGQTSYQGFAHITGRIRAVAYYVFIDVPKDSITDKAPIFKAVLAHLLLCPWHRLILTHCGMFMVWSTGWLPGYRIHLLLWNYVCEGALCTRVVIEITHLLSFFCSFVFFISEGEQQYTNKKHWTKTSAAIYQNQKQK